MGYTAIVDYGAGNLMSVMNALKYLGEESRIVSKPAELAGADRVILPGVGAFPAAMRELQKSGFVEPLRREAASGKPLLGICLGMQMLLDTGYEIEECKGLVLTPGTVKRIETPLKVPHIGWNSLRITNPCALTAGVEDGTYVYFVHSFCALTENAADAAAVTDYGAEVCAIIARGNVMGCQFHPEKSGEPGLLMLKNFCGM